MVAFSEEFLNENSIDALFANSVVMTIVPSFYHKCSLRVIIYCVAKAYDQ